MTRSIYEAEEQDLIEELRHRLKRLLTDEQYADTEMFIRFLIARNYELGAVETMLTNYLNWRKEQRIDTILDWYTPHEVCDKFLTLSHMGFDKEGDIVTYIDFGLDLKGMVKSVKSQDVALHVVRHIERDLKTIKELSNNTNKKFAKWTYVFNFENFSLATATHKPSLDLIGKMVHVYEANYPERLKAAILINTSWYFQIAFAVIKPLITGQTLQKIQMFGKEGWKEEFLNRIDANALPAFLGGTKTDPDGNPLCKTFLLHAEQIPDRYFSTYNRHAFSKQPGVKKLLINRLSKHQIEIMILYAGSQIEWEFVMKDRDIFVSLLYKENSQPLQNAKHIIPRYKCDTLISPESGIFKCEDPGIYYLEFDNSFSWLHQKEIYYKIQVVSPQNQIVTV